MHIRNVDGIAIKNVQREFTRNLLGPSSGLIYRFRRELLGLEPQWPCSLELNLEIFFNLCHDNIHSAKNFTHEASSPRILFVMENNSLKKRLARPSVRKELFTVAHHKP